MRFVVLLATILMSSATLSAPTFVSEETFSQEIVGKTLTSKTAKGVPFTATFKQGGTGDFQQKGKKAAKFKWTFSGATVCWDFGDFKECNNVEILSPTKANFYDAKSGS